MAKSRLSKIRQELRQYGGSVSLEDFPSLRTRRGTLRTRVTREQMEQFEREYEEFKRSRETLVEDAIEDFLNPSNWLHYHENTPSGKSLMEKVNNWCDFIMGWENGRYILGLGLSYARTAGVFAEVQEYAYDRDVQEKYLPKLMPYIYKASEQLQIELWEEQKVKAERLAREQAETQFEAYDPFANEDGLPEEFLRQF